MHELQALGLLDCVCPEKCCAPFQPWTQSEHALHCCGGAEVDLGITSGEGAVSEIARRQRIRLKRLIPRTTSAQH